MEEVIKPSSEVILVSVEDMNQITLIDPKTRGILEQYTDESSQIAKNTLCVAPKMGHIIGFQNQKTILNMWNINSKKVFLRVSCTEKITATAISNSEFYFAAASITGFVYIWETFSGDLIKKYKAHQKKITCLQFSNDDGLIISAGEDGICQIYLLSSLLASLSKMKLDLNNNKVELKARYILIGHSEKINCMTQSRGVLGKLYTAGSDKTVIVWDLSKGNKLGQFSVESEINCIEIDSQEEYVIIGCKNNNLYKIKVNDNFAYKIDLDEVTETPNIERQRMNKRIVFKGHNSEVTNVKLYEEAKQIISSSKDGLLIFWDFDGQIIKTMNMFNKSINNMCIFRRPKEFDQKNPLSHAKKMISFKAFHRYEEGESVNINENAKEHRFIMPSIQKAIKKQKKDKLTASSFLQTTKFLLGGAASASIVNSSATSSVSYTPEQIQEIILENQKLKALNHQLFNKQITNSSS
ncbi:hypothetical protein ABPG72_002073 [Tetrahymena utriculariae]